MASKSRSINEKRAALAAGQTASKELFRCPDCGLEEWRPARLDPRPICPVCFEGWDVMNARMKHPPAAGE